MGPLQRFPALAFVAVAALATATASATACRDAHPEVGVDVFSNDTVPARFIVTVTGTLAIALRSNNFFMRPDKSLVLETPGSLLIQSGAGTATIATLDSTHRIAVQPTGTNPDSSDAVAVVGHEIRMTRVGEERRVKLQLVRK